MSDLNLETVRIIIDRLGGDAVQLATSNAKHNSEDEHIKVLMDIVSTLEGRSAYSALTKFRKQIVRKIIISEINPTIKANLIEEIFDMEISPESSK